MASAGHGVSGESDLWGGDGMADAGTLTHGPTVALPIRLDVGAPNPARIDVLARLPRICRNRVAAAPA